MASAPQMMPRPIPAPLVDLIADRFRILGEPMRIRILDALRERPMTVKELTEELGGSQQNVSKHLQILAQARIVGREKEGTSVRCFIADDSVFALCETVCGGLRQRLSELEDALGATA